jgi:CBS domain-containing protein
MIYTNYDLSQKIETIAERDYVTLSPDILVGEVAKIMRDKGIMSVLVSGEHSDEPIGIFTERDILNRVVAENKGPFKVTLKEVMTSPLVTISEEESAKDAILLMRRKHIRRLAVKNSEGRITGIITLMSVVGNILNNRIDLAEVELPSSVIEKTEIKVVCPYCNSQFKDNTEMSNHIDRIHVGSGLL